MTNRIWLATINTITDIALLTSADQAASRRAYRSDSAAFGTWYAGCYLVVISAALKAEAAFIADQANPGFQASTLSRRVAAVTYAHALAGL